METLVVQNLLDVALTKDPYNPESHIHLASFWNGYPDLAVGAAYKALLLLDEAEDETGEFYEKVIESLFTKAERRSGKEFDEKGKETIIEELRAQAYAIIFGNLAYCGCLRSSIEIYWRATRQMTNKQIVKWRQSVPDLVSYVKNHHSADVATHFEHCLSPDSTPQSRDLELLPDTGLVRREVYPINTVQPDNLSPESLKWLNEQMHAVAPKLEIRAVDLPALTSTDTAKKKKTVTQLGVFATQDLTPGEIILNERSLLTANNRLQDALCEACSGALPDASSDQQAVACEECTTAIFCSAACHDLAQAQYHPAICDRDLESICRDGPASASADALYTLLLLRALAMSVQMDRHPLDLPAVKHIWGDFNPVPSSTSPSHSDKASPDFDPFHGAPRTLPFSFTSNIVIPLTCLLKMDIDIFRDGWRYDIWVFNTLFAKFRGTASARLSGLGQGSVARGPDVAAVHPMWCMANHSCDPNVGWEWGGVVQFQVRDERVRWSREAKGAVRDGAGEEEGKGDKETRPPGPAGIKKGEEILNHYCDVELDVKQRREWAAGALGGACRCPRCLWESGEV